MGAKGDPIDGVLLKWLHRGIGALIGKGAYVMPFALIGIAVLLSCLVLAIYMDSILLPVLFMASIGMAILLNMGTNFFFGEISADDTREFLFDNPHQGLAGIQRPHDFGTERFFFDAADEFFDDGEGHVGFKKRKTNFARHFARIFFREARLAAHGFQ